MSAVLHPGRGRLYLTITLTAAPRGTLASHNSGRSFMATTIPITCPKCAKPINAPAELAGKKIKCKGCANIFVVEAAPAPSDKASSGKKKPAKEEPAPVFALAADEPEDSNPYKVTKDTNTNPMCPFCATELDDEDQIICLNCGFNRDSRSREKMVKTHETTGGDWFLHLLPGILCAIGTLIMVIMIGFFWTLMRRWNFEWDAEGDWRQYISAYACQIWYTVMALFAGFFLCRFAVKRLILHPTPPEKEKIK
jgi:hypothetical protein